MVVSDILPKTSWNPKERKRFIGKSERIIQTRWRLKYFLCSPLYWEDDPIWPIFCWTTNHQTMCVFWFRQGPCALAKRLMICGLSFRGMHVKWPPRAAIEFVGSQDATIWNGCDGSPLSWPVGGLWSKWDIYQVASREIAIAFGQYTLQKEVHPTHTVSTARWTHHNARFSAISVVNCSNFGEFHVGNSFSTIGKDLPYPISDAARWRLYRLVGFDCSVSFRRL